MSSDGAAKLHLVAGALLFFSYSDLEPEVPTKLANNPVRSEELDRKGSPHLACGVDEGR